MPWWGYIFILVIPVFFVGIFALVGLIGLGGIWGKSMNIEQEFQMQEMQQMKDNLNLMEDSAENMANDLMEDVKKSATLAAQKAIIQFSSPAVLLCCDNGDSMLADPAVNGSDVCNEGNEVGLTWPEASDMSVPTIVKNCQDGTFTYTVVIENTGVETCDGKVATCTEEGCDFPEGCETESQDY